MKFYDQQGGVHKTFFGAKWKNMQLDNEEYENKMVERLTVRIMETCDTDCGVILGEKGYPGYRERAVEAFCNIMVTADNFTRDIRESRRREVIKRIVCALGIMEDQHE